MAIDAFWVLRITYDDYFNIDPTNIRKQMPLEFTTTGKSRKRCEFGIKTRWSVISILIRPTHLKLHQFTGPPSHMDVWIEIWDNCRSETEIDENIQDGKY